MQSMDLCRAQYDAGTRPALLAEKRDTAWASQQLLCVRTEGRDASGWFWSDARSVRPARRRFRQLRCAERRPAALPGRMRRKQLVRGVGLCTAAKTALLAEELFARAGEKQNGHHRLPWKRHDRLYRRRVGIHWSGL